MILFKLKMSKIHVGKIRLGEEDWIVGVLKDYFIGHKACKTLYIHEL